MVYLLHGIGGDEKEWLNGGHPQVILDNLYAENKIEPMIVVLPNGRAMKDDRAGGNIMAPEKVQAFATFEKDLLNDLIPFIEKKYPVIADRKHRAMTSVASSPPPGCFAAIASTGSSFREIRRNVESLAIGAPAVLRRDRSQPCTSTLRQSCDPTGSPHRTRFGTLIF